MVDLGRKPHWLHSRGVDVYVEEGRTLAEPLPVEKVIEDIRFKQTQCFLGSFVPKLIKTHKIVSTGAALPSTSPSVPEQSGNRLSKRYFYSYDPVLHNSSSLRSIICTDENSSIQ